MKTDADQPNSLPAGPNRSVYAAKLPAPKMLTYVCLIASRYGSSCFVLVLSFDYVELQSNGVGAKLRNCAVGLAAAAAMILPMTMAPSPVSDVLRCRNYSLLTFSNFKSAF